MKTKNYLQLKSWLLMMLMLIGVGGNLWGQSITFDFEEETAHRTEGTNNYTGTNTYEENDVQFSIYLGDAVNTTAAIEGYSIVGRIAKNTTNSPIATFSSISNDGFKITSVSYKCKGNSNITLKAEYSIDNTNWQTLLSGSCDSNGKDNIKDNLSIVSDVFYLRFTGTVGSSTKSNRDFAIDNIVITREAIGGDTPTKTDIATLTSISPTELTVGDNGNFTLGATYANDAYSISWETANTDVLEVSGNSYNAKAAGTANVTVKVTPTDTETYEEVNKTFTVTVKEAPLANIAALSAKAEAGEYDVALTDAVVTYVNGNYAYIQDASGAIVMYKSGHGLTAGKVLNGTATVTYQVRNGNPQITALSGHTATDGTDPEPTTLKASEWNTSIASVLSQYFKITDATITQDGNKYYVQLGGENVQLYKVGSAFSVSDLDALYTIVGFPTLYNTTIELQIFEDPQLQTYAITPSVNISEGGHVEYANGVITAVLNPGYRFADPAYTIVAGTATVTQNGNQFIVKATSDCEIEINFEAIPSHNVVWSVNGTETTTTALEDAAVEFPTAPEAIEGKTFVGWVTAEIDGETDTKPEFVTSAIGAAGLKFYAVFANKTGGSTTEVTDELTTADLTATNTTYTDFSNVSKSSDAVYAGNSAKSTENAIQLRSKNSNSGIVSTTSGGTVKSVTITVQTGTNTIDIYGSNVPYTAASDLYATGDNNNQGTKVGSLSETGTVEFSNDYAYVGIRSNNGAAYLSNVSITWETGTPATYSGYTTTVDVPIIISTVEELKAFRDAVNGGNQFAGKTVKLAADLDLSGEENWTPIGNLVAYPTQSFNGVFDGDGHKISNVTVVDNTPNYAVAGLFGSVVNGTIKNLTVENVNLTSSHYAGGIVAYTSNKPIIENCHVIGGTITSVPELINGSYDNGDKVGGIMGYATAGSTINNCTVDGLTIKAYRDMGGIVGFSAGNVTNNTVKNTTIIQSDVNAYKNEEITTYDYIVGRNGGATLENNVYEELNNVLTIDGAVAKIGDKLYRKLQAAVDAATEEDNVVTLLTDINLASDNVSINKAVTIKGEGHTIVSKATQAIAISGAGNVTIDNTVITSQNRGINVLNVTSGFTLNVENSTIQTNVEDPTTTYTTGENSRGINIANADGVTVNISNSTIQGYSYNINIPTSGKNLTVNMTGGKTYGRAAVNNWGSNNTITLDGVEVHGLNNQTGPTEAFACVVDNEGAQNNTFVLKDCQFTGTLSEAALTTEGSTASEHLLQLDGMNAIVKVLGSTTYSCNSDDKSRGGIFYTESYLNNNKLYFDDTTKQTFANAFELSVISDEKDAEVDLYPVSFEPEVLYYWATESGYQGGYYNFAEPFVEGWLDNGEFIALQKDITLTEDITCQLASGTSFNFLLGDFTADKNGHSVALNTGVTVLTDKQTDIFKAAEVGYVIVETETETGYSYTAEKVMLAQPIIFHDGGKYEGALIVAIAGQGVKYTLNGGAEQTYSAPFSISETTTVKAWAEKDGVKSDEVEKTFTIVAKQAGAEVADGYYNIKTNDGKFVNVAGRKTVTLVSDTEGKAGTVIRVNADAEGVKVLRSQGVDLPGYAKKAMSYVPELAKEIVNKLAANVDDPIIGEQGVDLILAKFNKEFDYHLYLEEANGGYRIYGRTPSMKPVVDFYAENKDLVDSRLSKVEDFVKEVLQKIVDKMGRGQSVVDMFKIKTVWENMGGTLTDPDVDQAKFFEEVLSSEENTWQFAYQTGMLYWEKVKGYLNENAGDLGDYGKYLEKIPNVQPNFKYYIVPSASGVDIISQGNVAIENDEASAIWTLTPCEKFVAKMNVVSEKNIYTTTANETVSCKEYYTTLYTDFAYTLPEGVKAYKINGINTKYNTVLKEALKSTTIPAQTPVLLFAQDDEIELTLDTNDGSALSDNTLYGNDWLINKYELNTPQLETIFALLTKLSSSLGERYEHLKRLNAGTVNNKYFFNLAVPTEEGDFKEDLNNGKIKVLTNGENGIGFYSNFDKNLVGNEAFMFSEDYNPIMLSLIGDVNRDGDISIADVTALVNIILGKAKYPDDLDKYDFDAANVNRDTQISIADVTKLVNIILGKK